MREQLLNSYAFNLRYAKVLVDDVSEELMTSSSGEGLENHPAWTLGHLITGAAMTAAYLGGKNDIPEDWIAIFKRNGPGDPRLPDRDASKYPTKAELLAELERQHQKVEGLIRDVRDETWEEKRQWKLSDHLPRFGDLIHYMCITHEANHLGQLAAWRRSKALPSALKKLRSDY